MSQRSLHDIAVVGIHNTRQARRLEHQDSLTIAVEAAQGALSDAGLSVDAVDGVAGVLGLEVGHQIGAAPMWRSASVLGLATIIDAAAAIATGLCRTVLVVTGVAGRHVDRSKTAPWTRPDNEFMAPYGMYTAVQFALIARRHMQMFGTTSEHLAMVAASIRTNGSMNPAAVLHGTGPVSVHDVLDSRMIADPLHLLDCAITSEGGSALVLTSAGRVGDCSSTPVWFHGAGCEAIGPPYQHPPLWDRRGRRTDTPSLGTVGGRASAQAFAAAGLRPAQVDVCELYDPFSFEVLRQLEAFGFCGIGESGPFVADGGIAPDSALPITTDGGSLSFSHPSGAVQQLQRVVRAVEQLRGECTVGQVPGAEVALVSDGSGPALYTDVLLLGRHRA